MWRLTEEHLESIAIGAGILGTGGGGNPYVGMLRAREALRRYSPVDVLTPEELDEDARVVCVGGIGAPTVGIEKIRDIQAYHALRALEDYVGEKATALISNEMGGSNSLEPIIPASIAGLPIVDGDAMGRAFPELQMKTFFIYGVPWFPLALADEKGNSAIFPKAISAKWMERMARAVTIQMGCIACYALAPMSAEQIRRTAVPHTLTLALSLGRAVKSAQARHEDPIEAIMSVYPGRVLFQGKIVDLERRTTTGFARGKVVIDGVGNYAPGQMSIEFQNENLIASIDGQVVCLVPDLICLVDSERGEPITTELLRYGFRVTVFGFPAHPLLKTPQALEVVGPEAFGYPHEYVPLEV